MKLQNLIDIQSGLKERYEMVLEAIEADHIGSTLTRISEYIDYVKSHSTLESILKNNILKERDKLLKKDESVRDRRVIFDYSATYIWGKYSDLELVNRVIKYEKERASGKKPRIKPTSAYDELSKRHRALSPFSELYRQAKSGTADNQNIFLRTDYKHLILEVHEIFMSEMNNKIQKKEEDERSKSYRLKREEGGRVILNDKYIVCEPTFASRPDYMMEYLFKHRGKMTKTTDLEAYLEKQDLSLGSTRVTQILNSLNFKGELRKMFIDSSTWNIKLRNNLSAENAEKLNIDVKKLEKLLLELKTVDLN